MRTARFLSAFGGFATVLLAALSIAIASDAPAGGPGALPDTLRSIVPSPNVSGVAFFTEKTRLWLGRSQIVCFYAADALQENRFFSFYADEEALHVLIPPTLMPGTHIGYIRVRPLREGRTEITLEGTSLDIDVAADTASNTLDLTRPEIVSPAEGAVVWGKFAVGVERLHLSTSRLGPGPVLRLPDGSEIEAQPVPDQQPGPHLHYVYTVDAAMLKPGPNEFVAIARDAEGREIASDPLSVVMLAPADSAMLAGNCRDQVQTQLPAPKVPPPGAPKAFTPPSVVQDDKSIYGEIVYLPANNPPWCMPVHIPAKGLYQMIVTARGDFGGNSLPMVGVLIDDAGAAATTAQLATTDWQRVPVGHPFVLEAGDHVVSVRFRNDFVSGQLDYRRLYLARYELARLDEVPPPALAGNDPTRTMQDESATPFNQKTVAAAAKEESAPSPETRALTHAMMQSLASPSGFHVAFRDNLDGKTIAGEVEIAALAWWPGRPHAPPPKIDLLVNNEVAASETSPGPRFHLESAAFQPGPNSLQLQATLPDGRSVRGVTEHLILPPSLARPVHNYRLHYRYRVYDPAWGDSLASRLETDKDDPVANFFTNGDALLTLPDDLSGAYKISVEARGTDDNGPAVATLLLRQNGQETRLADLPALDRLAFLSAPPVTLSAGPKTLVVRFGNDAYDPGKADRNLFVHAVALDPVLPPDDHPVIWSRILYPANGAAVGLADAVVADAGGSRGVVTSDLVIDGQPQHLGARAAHGLGLTLLPLLTRDLAAGNHQAQVRARDGAGHTVDSPPVSFTLADPRAVVASPYARALTLLNRFGYGPEPAELATLLTDGADNWLASRIEETTASPAEENERVRLQAEHPEINDVVARATEYLLTDANPVRARFLVWTENHFSTWANKAGAADKSREHDRFLDLGIAPFCDLLLASATSPAMLIYLDQYNSRAERLNENYAREIMELHTLGVKGGYTQKDVTALADLLTGWTMADEAPRDGSRDPQRKFRYNPYLNSGSALAVLGMEFDGVPLAGRFDRVLTALNLLAAHPSCSLFIGRKLAEHYVADPAPPALVDRLARTYLESGGDLRTLLRALAQQPALFDAPPKVASPLDFAVRLARLAGLESPGPVIDLTAHSGMGMFDRATPDGYPDTDGFFASSNALLQRWQFAQKIRDAFLAHDLIPHDWRPADDKWDAATTQRLVDLASFRITGSVLGPASNAAALQLLAAAPAQTDQRLRLLATFVCQVPESSLR